MADYDPFKAMAKASPCPAKCIVRVQKELKRMIEDPLPAIHVYPDPDEKNRPSCFHGIVEGPDGTPYEKGLFWFFVYSPPDFPFMPPKALLMSTGNGSVRFNPNLYNDGKVCLSILGTYSGPGWSAITGLKGVMLSIQSLFGEQPHMNEPGMRNPPQTTLNRYLDTLRHESIAEAACAMAEHGTKGAERMPPQLLRRARELFLRNADWYIAQCTPERIRDDGKRMGELQFQSWQDNRKCFKWGELKKQVERLKQKFFAEGLFPAPPIMTKFPMNTTAVAPENEVKKEGEDTVPQTGAAEAAKAESPEGKKRTRGSDAEAGAAGETASGKKRKTTKKETAQKSKVTAP